MSLSGEKTFQWVYMSKDTHCINCLHVCVLYLSTCCSLSTSWWGVEKASSRHTSSDRGSKGDSETVYRKTRCPSKSMQYSLCQVLFAIYRYVYFKFSLFVCFYQYKHAVHAAYGHMYSTHGTCSTQLWVYSTHGTCSTQLWVQYTTLSTVHTRNMQYTTLSTVHTEHAVYNSECTVCSELSIVRHTLSATPFASLILQYSCDSSIWPH